MGAYFLLHNHSAGSPAFASRIATLHNRSAILLIDPYLIASEITCFLREPATSIWTRKLYLAKFPFGSPKSSTTDSSRSHFPSDVGIPQGRVFLLSNPHQISLSEHPFTALIFWVTNSNLNCETSNLNRSSWEGCHRIEKVGSALPRILKGDIVWVTYLPHSHFKYHKDSSLTLSRRKTFCFDTLRCWREFPVEDFNSSKWRKELVLITLPLSLGRGNFYQAKKITSKSITWVIIWFPFIVRSHQSINSMCNLSSIYT